MKKTLPEKTKIDEENRKLRMLRLKVDLTLSLIYQSSSTREEAYEHIESVRKFALELFPGKEEVFEILYTPKFKRAIREVYGFN